MCTFYFPPTAHITFCMGVRGSHNGISIVVLVFVIVNVILFVILIRIYVCSCICNFICIQLGPNGTQVCQTGPTLAHLGLNLAPTWPQLGMILCMEPFDVIILFTRHCTHDHEMENLWIGPPGEMNGSLHQESPFGFCSRVID